jgi:hypothetical protein
MNRNFSDGGFLPKAATPGGCAAHAKLFHLFDDGQLGGSPGLETGQSFQEMLRGNLDRHELHQTGFSALTLLLVPYLLSDAE